MKFNNSFSRTHTKDVNSEEDTFIAMCACAFHCSLIWLADSPTSVFNLHFFSFKYFLSRRNWKNRSQITQRALASLPNHHFWRTKNFEHVRRISIRLIYCFGHPIQRTMLEMEINELIFVKYDGDWMDLGGLVSVGNIEIEKFLMRRLRISRLRQLLSLGTRCLNHVHSSMLHSKRAKQGLEHWVTNW